VANDYRWRRVAPLPSRRLRSSRSCRASYSAVVCLVSSYRCSPRCVRVVARIRALLLGLASVSRWKTLIRGGRCIGRSGPPSPSRPEMAAGLSSLLRGFIQVSLRSSAEGSRRIRTHKPARQISAEICSRWSVQWDKAAIKSHCRRSRNCSQARSGRLTRANDVRTMRAVTQHESTDFAGRLERRLRTPRRCHNSPSRQAWSNALPPSLIRPAVRVRTMVIRGTRSRGPTPGGIGARGTHTPRARWPGPHHRAGQRFGSRRGDAR